MNFKKIKEISLAMAPKHPTDQRCRHFSFILYKKKILTIGFNSPKTHPINLKHKFVNKYNNPINDLVGTHSELNAIIKFGEEDCSGLTLINTRVNRRNEIDLSCPCDGCKDLISKLNFKKVFYSDKHGKFERLYIK